MAHRFANSKSSLLMTTARQWLLMDATGQELDNLARVVCKHLEGRHKPIYSNVLDTGDHVVVINTRNMIIPERKVLWWYSGYAQGYRHCYGKDFHIFRPTEILRLQVKLRLPHRTKHEINQRDARLYRLHLFPGSSYPYAGNISKVIEGPDKLFRPLEDYTKEERSQFVVAPDSRIREPEPLYDWEDLE